MSFTIATAVDATAAVLEGVGFGRVHKYRRMIRQQSDVTALLLDATTGKISAAFISAARVKTSRDFGNPQAAGVLTEVALQVELFRGLEDALESELAFRDQVFAVLQAVNMRGKIDAFASHQEPMNADQIGYIAFAGDVLLHYANCNFSLRGRTSPPAS